MGIFDDLATAWRSGTVVAEEGAGVVGEAVEGVGDGFVATWGMVQGVCDTHLEGPRSSVSWDSVAMSTEGLGSYCLVLSLTGTSEISS